MKRTIFMTAAVAALAIAAARSGEAGPLARACHRCLPPVPCPVRGAAAMQQRAGEIPWHGNYYHAAWGTPVALVVPPTSRTQVHYSWGVSGTRVVPLYHQFSRGYPGPYTQQGFMHTPQWPSDTTMFGVYSVRGPW